MSIVSWGENETINIVGNQIICTPDNITIIKNICEDLQNHNYHKYNILRFPISILEITLHNNKYRLLWSGIISDSFLQFKKDFNNYIKLKSFW
jgi:hypothetical protein